MEPASPSPYPQVPPTCPYPEPTPSSPSNFLKIHLNIILPSTSWSPQWPLSLRLPHQHPQIIYTVQWNFEIWYFLDISHTYFCGNSKIEPGVCVCVYVCVCMCVCVYMHVRVVWIASSAKETTSCQPPPPSPPQKKNKYLRIRKVEIFKFSWTFSCVKPVIFFSSFDTMN